MRIKFDDKSYIDAKRSDDPNKPKHVVIMIGARDAENPLKLNVSAVELTPDQFKTLLVDLA